MPEEMNEPVEKIGIGSSADTFDLGQTAVS
jgi:hypothetical protein